MTTSLPTRAVTVVVMAFNEAETVEATCAELQSLLEALHTPYELLIVDDGSTDGTTALCDSISARSSSVRVIHHAENKGLGGVYRTGFAEARGDFLTFFPADGQFPAAIIASFLPHMDAYEMVLGYLPSRDRGIVAESLSAVERLLYRMLLGRMPRFQGVLMFRRELLESHPLRSSGRGWAVLMELIVRSARAKRRMISVPTDVRPRMHGVSKVNNFRTIWSNLRQLLALRRLITDQ